MGEGRIFEKPISDQEVDEAGELELAQRTENSEFAAKEERLSYLVQKLDKEYFHNLVYEFGELQKNTENIDKVYEIVSRETIENAIDFVRKTIPELMDKVTDLIDKRGIDLGDVKKCSLEAVLTNSILSGIGGVKWIMENINSDNSTIQDKINNPDSVRRKLAEKFEQSFKSDSIVYYIEELLSDEEKLAYEISTIPGYISRFSEYFEEDVALRGEDFNQGKRYPLGGEKLPYFRLLSELEKGNIKDENNLERELEKLNDEIIRKEKVKKDFKENKFVKK
ncbi:MAG: hypothetical protein OEV93_02210 [Candidatus Moranbacteria bacterium]|nr:hypothetical protein [Candidatus Moranbacteria bacterium]